MKTLHLHIEEEFSENMMIGSCFPAEYFYKDEVTGGRSPGLQFANAEKLPLSAGESFCLIFANSFGNFQL